MKVNDACAMCVKRFIFRRNVFLNVSDQFLEDDILIKGTYDMLCNTIKELEIVLDKDNNLSVNGKVDKYGIIYEIIIATQHIGFIYGMYNTNLLNEAMKTLYYDDEKFNLLNMHYVRLIKSFVYIIYCL